MISINLRSLVLVLPIILAAVLAGCDGADNAATQTDDALTSYTEAKRLEGLTEVQARELTDLLRERQALADAIVRGDTLDMAAIEAEVADFRRELIIARYLEQAVEAGLDDAALQRHYEANQQRYRDRQWHAAHILFRVQTSKGEDENQAQRERALAVYQQLQAGADFAELARSRSDDVASGERGGDLGWIAESELDPRLAEALANLNPGQYSAPFATDFGFHIVKLLAPPKQTQRSFNAVKHELRHELRQQMTASQMQVLAGSTDNNR